MKKVIILLILAILSTSLYAKLPRAYVSVKPKEIQSGDRVEVIIAAIAKKNAKMSFPKVEEIDKNKVLKRKSAVSHSIEEINGVKTPLTKRTITHIIKPSKSFDVATYIIKIDGKEYKTVPFRVKVLGSETVDNSDVAVAKKEENISQASSANSSTNTQSEQLATTSDFVFKMSTNKKSAVVGESFIVKVELLEPIDLSSSDLQYTAPTFKGFSATPLGDGKTLEKGNSVIRVIEYLVTPKKDGNLVITPAKAKVGIQMTPQAQSPFGFFGTDVQWKNLKTNSIKIAVAKPPKSVDFIGKYRIKTKTESEYAKPNKPFSYTIEIEGIGNLEDIKEPNIKIKDITSYAQEPKIEHVMNKDKIYSKYSKTFTFISDKDFTIPSIEYQVYAPSIKKVYTLKTKPLQVKVKRNKSISDALTNSSAVSSSLNNKTRDRNTTNKKSAVPVVKSSEELEKVEDLLFDKYYYKRKYTKEGYPFSAIIGALILGIILGAGAMVLIPSLLKIGKKSKNNSKIYGSYEEALNILYPHTTKSKNIENMVEQLYEVVNGNRDIKIDEYALDKLIKDVTQS